MRLFTHSLLIASAVIGLVSLSAPARAESPVQGGYIGALLGVAKPSAEGFDDFRLGYGAQAGVKLLDQFGAGLYFFNSTSEATVLGQIVENATTFYGIEGDYYFQDTLKGLRVGPKIGLARTGSKVTINNVETDTSQTDLSVGPHIGYNYPINEQFSAGAEANLLWSFADNSYNVLHVLGTVRFNF